MSKIIVDQIQKSGGAALTLPSADGTAGQLLKTDGYGVLSFVSETTQSIQTCVYSKAFALTGANNTDPLNMVKWTDVLAGVTVDNIIQVKISGHLRASTTFKPRFIGVDSSGNNITTGYLGGGYNDWYNGDNQTNSSPNNSNQGWVEFPGYTTAYGSNSDSYGNGIQFEYMMTPHKFGSTGGHFHQIKYTYQQDTSYNSPNHGTMNWNSYSSSAPPASWEGVRVYPTSGTWDTANHGNLIVVELLTNNQ
jgi:hypothetical protein